MQRDDHLWIFNAGDSFSGNPKWLFLWMTENRKDIDLYWFCYKKSTEKYVKSLGFKACRYDSSQGADIGSRAGVYVVEQKKEIFQDYLKGIKILNLWHGVGCKTVERQIKAGFLNERIIKKAILNAEYYEKYQLFLVTSPLMENHFIHQCGVPKDLVLRAGYPRCEYQVNYVSFNHDMLSQKGLSADTKIAVYAPTYRDWSADSFFADAIPDMELLLKALEENNFLLVLKLHPKMESDYQFRNIRRRYENNSRLLFWNNADDFYEVMDQVDLAIVDYSSILYDLLERGVKSVIRYAFDYEREAKVREFALDYWSMSCGRICSSFDELIEALHRDNTVPSEELVRIKDAFWSYGGKDSCRTIVDATLAFEPDVEKKLPTLYSFDVFDTLISRSSKTPESVFKYVQDRLRMSDEGFSAYFIANYHKIRKWAEANCREYYRKTQLERQTDEIEISFDMIFDRMAAVWSLDERQCKLLAEWELECEYACSIPRHEGIEELKERLSEGCTVVLICDMYLPRAFIEKLLEKADPVLLTLPLYVSSEYGVQKTTKKLFFEVYHSFDYHFGSWVHYGDNALADGKAPAALGIRTVNHTIRDFDSYEKQLVSFVDSYDAYQVSSLMFRFRTTAHSEIDVFSYCYAALYWVPYIYWAISHAVSYGYETLYFISRDGYYLKIIADTIIKCRQLGIKTKYIYGSRKAWRIPSQVNEIDDDFFSDHGNFAEVRNYKKLVEASGVPADEFADLFPELDFLKTQENIDAAELKLIRNVLEQSASYRARLLEAASREREVVAKYLLQEIDFSERFAFVEYWGRGYTQTCLGKIIWEECDAQAAVPFYYARCIYPSEPQLPRYNFTGNNYSLLFVEALFANVPYKSVAAYEDTGSGVAPIIVPCDNNEELHVALCSNLQAFTRDYCNLSVRDFDSLGRSLFDFGLSYFHRNESAAVFSNTIGSLKDAVATHGTIVEYAPELTFKEVRLMLGGQKFQTKSWQMSLERSTGLAARLVRFYRKNLRSIPAVKKTVRRIQKLHKGQSAKR